ncbi:MAG: PIN domain-containing protein [Pseudomonadota bacterium]
MAVRSDGAGAERWFLDACVLYPQLLRGVLLGLGRAGLVQPFWSERVLEEWRIAAARAGGMAAEATVRGEVAAMEAAFPGAAVVPDPGLEAVLSLPDPADAHVAAGAASAGARVITLNIRDFPARRLASHGLEAEHADSALWRLHGSAPEAVSRSVAEAAALLAPGAGLRGALKRAGVPRFAKAVTTPES